MNNLRKFIKLSWFEQRLLVQTFLLVAAIRLGLWTLRLKRVRWLFEHSVARGRVASASRASVEQLVWAVSVASSFVPHASCLTQALAMRTLMIRSGHPGELCIGVARPVGGAFSAHAWVQSEGTIVIGGPAEYVAQYTPLPL